MTNSTNARALPLDHFQWSPRHPFSIISMIRPIVVACLITLVISTTPFRVEAAPFGVRNPANLLRMSKVVRFTSKLGRGLGKMGNWAKDSYTKGLKHVQDNKLKYALKVGVTGAGIGTMDGLNSKWNNQAKKEREEIAREQHELNKKNEELNQIREEHEAAQRQFNDNVLDRMNHADEWIIQGNQAQQAILANQKAMYDSFHGSNPSPVDHMGTAQFTPDYGNFDSNMVLPPPPPLPSNFQSMPPPPPPSFPSNAGYGHYPQQIPSPEFYGNAQYSSNIYSSNMSPSNPTPAQHHTFRPTFTDHINPFL